MKTEIPIHTVTSFVSSKAKQQLTTRRVLFHITDRMRRYDLSTLTVIQSTFPPVSVALCPTSKCVRQCTFCSNTKRNKKNRIIGAQYSEDVFRQIIDDLNSIGVLGISVAGGGEPLTYGKKVFFEFLTQHNPSYKIGIHTNGVLLGNILLNRIIKAGNIAYINISVLAHTPQLYGEVSQTDGSQFFTLEKNLRHAVRLQSQFKKFPALGVKVLICRDNYRHVWDIVQYFESLGIQNILLRCVGNFEPGQDVELHPLQNKELVDILKERLSSKEDQIQAIIGKPNQILSVPSRCWILALQYTAGIDPDGETYLCSPWSQKEYSIGNVNTKRFIEI